MCLICTEWAKGRMSLNEADRNAKEMMEFATESEKEHLQETLDKIHQEDEFEWWRELAKNLSKK